MRVLISGAGIAGPALAWFLARSGARVTVVERSHSLLTQGHNIDITGSAITVARKMGLLDEIRRHNTTEKGTQFIDPQGRPFAPFPVNKGSRASFSSEFEILRGDLAAVLHEATRNHSSVEYLFGTTVQNIVSNDDKSVKVQLDNGQTEEYDLLVAADGQWSRVRKHSFDPQAVNVIDKGLYVIYFTVPRLAEDNEWWNIYIALKSRTVALRPDPHGTIRAMLTVMPRDDAQKKIWSAAARSNREAQQALVVKEFADAGWQTQRLLDAMKTSPEFYFQAVQQIKMSRWSNSRVVCLGDAGYAPTPLTGMGTSLALVGAYVLGGELSQVKNGEHPAQALAAYEAKFRPFVEETQKIPFFVPAIAHPDTAWKRSLQRGMVSTMSRIAGTPWMINRFEGATHKDDFPLPDYPNIVGYGAE